MLKGNLSTRPFYNDRLLALTLTVIALGALLLTAFNATQLRSLSKERGQFDGLIDKDAAETHKLEMETAQLRSTLDLSGMKLLRIGADEANDLIDKRTFSWTAFLGVIEKTLPYGARLVEVTPKPEKNVMNIAVTVVCKTPNDLYSFVNALEKTDLFKDVVASSRNPNEDGTETALVEAIYLPHTGEPVAPRGKSGKGRP